MGKLFAFDLDGTLVHSLKSNDSESSSLLRTIPNYLRETVYHLSLQHSVIVATGRRFRTAWPDVSLLPKSPYVVVNNGSVIADWAGNTIQKSSLSRSDLIAVSDILHHLQTPFLVITDGYQNSIDFAFFREHLDGSDFIRRVSERSKGFHQLIDNLDEIKLDCLEFAILGLYEDLCELKSKLELLIPKSLRCLIVRNIGYTEWSALEILPKEVSKWTGVSWVAEQLGVDQVIAVGDDENDLEMLRFSDLGIAMGHSAAHVKAAANRVVEGPEQLNLFLRENYLNEKS